jgi:hypothetical protein
VGTIPSRYRVRWEHPADAACDIKAPPGMSRIVTDVTGPTDDYVQFADPVGPDPRTKKKAGNREMARVAPVPR